MNFLELPYAQPDPKHSVILPPSIFPYQLAFYFIRQSRPHIRVFKEVEHEIKDLIKRYAIVLPETVSLYEKDGDQRYRCLVRDEGSTVTRGILERLSYTLETSYYTAYGLYWIELKTKKGVE